MERHGYLATVETQLTLSGSCKLFHPILPSLLIPRLPSTFYTALKTHLCSALPSVPSSSVLVLWDLPAQAEDCSLPLGISLARGLGQLWAHLKAWKAGTHLCKERPVASPLVLGRPPEKPGQQQ